MKRRICAIVVVTMLFAATAFAAASDQASNGNSWEQMYQYCNQMMQSWGGGKAPDQSGKTQPQGQPMSYNGGVAMGNGMMGGGMMGSGMMNGQGHMMGNGNTGHMMGNSGYGNMMGNGGPGNMMGTGSYGNMMSVVEFQ